MGWQPASQAVRLAKLFLFFFLSPLRPPAFVFADIVLAGVNFCSPPFFPGFMLFVLSSNLP